jgi:hypothetical protein
VASLYISIRIGEKRKTWEIGKESREEKRGKLI